MIIGKKEFDVKNETYVMGILNVTAGFRFRMEENITVWIEHLHMQNR